MVLSRQDVRAELEVTAEATSSRIPKPKAILIAVSDGFGGYGDFLFALKLSEQLRKQYADAGATVPPVYLVTQPSGQQKIRSLKGDVEFGVDVLTPDELRVKVDTKEIEVGTLIEAPVFQAELMERIDGALENTDGRVPLIMIPEYGYNSESNRAGIAFHRRYRQRQCSHLEYASTIYSGFKEDAAECGILLSDALVHPAPPEELVSQLDEKVRRPLLCAVDIARYQETTELCMQYSHDTYTSGKKPAAHFLQIHREFCKTSDKNQDVVMVGKSQADKRAALESIKDKLIADGFKRISFYNSESGAEEVLYDAGEGGKAYRVIYASGMSHTSMIACNALSGPLTGATGDQSFGEALSSGKMMVYECLSHKQTLIQNYDAAIREASRNDPDIDETLRLLREATTEAEYQRLGEQLRSSAIQEKFQRLNRDVLEKFDFVSQVVRANYHCEVIRLLKAGEQKKALDIMMAHESLINMDDEFAGKPLWQHAKDYDQEGVFVHYYYQSEVVRFLQSGQEKEAFELIVKHNIGMSSEFKGKSLHQYVIDDYPRGLIVQHLKRQEFLWHVSVKQFDKALTLLEEFKFDPFFKLGKKTLLAKLLTAGAYEITDRMILEVKTAEEQQKLCAVLQSKSHNGETYLAKLRREHPVVDYPATGQASFLSTLNQLAKYHPKPGTKRAEMHQSFQELVKTFTDLSTYDDKAFIGLLLLNKKNIASEYGWLSPRKGVFFGSRLYSICEDALKDLGVDLRHITPEQEQEYYQALANVIHKKPEYLANDYILQSLSEQAGIEGLPRVEPLVSETAARKILAESPRKDDPTILRTSTGFYKLNPEPLGAGNWGSVYAGRHYSLVDDKIVISEPVAVKKTSIENALSLDKEHQNFRAAYPDGHFERFEKGRYSYLAMPLIPGVQLDKYLSSHQGLTRHERLCMAKDLLANLKSVHDGGITHNDLKLPNILFDPVEKKMRIIDFGCAETHGTHMKYENIYTSIFAFEMPPEYLRGTISQPQLDVFAVTSIVAEILGLDKNELVKTRMLKVFETLDDPILRRDMQIAFERAKNLGDAFFTSPLSNHHSNPNLELFVAQYVSQPYDFSPYQDQLGDDIIDLLNGMQAQNPDERPSLTHCLAQLEHAIASSPAPILQEGDELDYRAEMERMHREDELRYEDVGLSARH
ncbi:protein kinase domain-containing protein [Legionella nagasakiensis]|uniref:protein kinase domain-containing protein n=1 Tax=Legionella nagasakiensis TaxID=535290 RepID=UPI0010568E63|nr:protein kinase [Legionella nagasakiensis]